MGSYKQEGDILGKGKDCYVRAGANPAAASEIGFVKEYTIRKSIQTDSAEVLGEILPVSIDPVSVAVSLSMSGFIPKKGIHLDSKDTLKSFNADDDAILDSGQTLKIPYIDFIDKTTGAIMHSTTWATLTTYAEATTGKGYTIVSCDFASIGLYNGKDYPTSKIFEK